MRALICFLFAFSGFIFADFSYKQTTRVTGGSMTKFMKMGGGKSLEPTTSMVYMKDGKMAHVDEDTMMILDVEAQTMTNVDLKKKTYTVVTFQELRQAMEEASRKMREAQGKENAKGAMSFKVDVQESGATKSINGLSTREYLVRMNMEAKDESGNTVPLPMRMESSNWMASDIPGYEEARRILAAMAARSGWTPGMNPMAVSQTGMGEGVSKMVEELSKIKGVPVSAITRIYGIALPSMGDIMRSSTGGGGSNDGRSAGEAAADAATRSAEQEAIWQAARAGGPAGRIGAAAMGGMLGGLRNRKPKEQPKQEEAAAKPAQAPAQPGSSLMLESETNYSDWSSASISSDKLAVPSGFKQVDSDIKKAMREAK